jgi:aryl-alcohol dehydrogenase-like predicted oxidoreductase|tara:strand:+ start:8056 stop:9105 length:1050 start_codon:yes stop_codon:yes gene_type:complete
MNFKKLGNTDLKVSTICLGTMTWGEQNTQKDAFEQIDYAVDQGINFFDTAELYAVPMKLETRGKTSQYIGEWFSTTKKRDKVILADKVAGTSGMDWLRPNNETTSLNKKQIKFACERSLKDLKTDYIDLYQVHWTDRPSGAFSGKLEYEHKNTDNLVSIEETLDGLNNLVKAGYVRHIGISNETAWGTSQYLKLAEQKKLTKIVSIQNAYNFLNRGFEVGLSEIAIREKVGLLAYSPLASGYLSGKYRNGAMPKNSRMDLFYDFWPRYRTLNSEKAIEEYWNLAQKFNLNLAQIAIKFCEIQPFLTSVIIGATTMEQLKTNIDSVNINLDSEVIKQIGEIHKKYPNPCP